MRRSAPRNSSFRLLLGCLLLSPVLIQCGAVGQTAPFNVEPPPSQCRPLTESMPNFYRLLRDPDEPLKGLETVIELLAAQDPQATMRNPIAALLRHGVLGLKSFTKDPPERPDATCLSLSEFERLSRPSLPLCSVEALPGEECENRMCSMQRILSLALRDEAAKNALEALRPLLQKVIGYMANTGVGADGAEHFEIVEVLHRSAHNPSLCAPENLVDVIDGVIVFFRNSTECGLDCPGIRAIESVERVVKNPMLQDLLLSFENKEGGTGRQGFQTLGRVLGQSFESMPEDERYFNAVDDVLKLLYQFMDSDPQKYGVLKADVEEVVGVARVLLNPAREGAFLRQLKGVARCMNQLDTEQAVVGALYDLLSRSGEEGDGLDVAELVTTVADLMRLDESGVFANSLHALFFSLRQDDEALEALRRFLGEVQTVENARLAFPAMQRMVGEGVVDELIDLLDEMMFGCKARTE